MVKKQSTAHPTNSATRETMTPALTVTKQLRSINNKTTKVLKSLYNDLDF